jgi:hypothetical protein
LVYFYRFGKIWQPCSEIILSVWSLGHFWTNFNLFPKIERKLGAQSCNEYLTSFNAGVPDGILSYKKYQLEYILERLGIENVYFYGIFYGYLEHFIAFCNMVLPFGKVSSNYVI